MLGQKKHVFIAIVIICLIWIVDQPVSAETKYVNECLDEKSNCLEDVTVNKENSGNNHTYMESLHTVDRQSLILNFVKMIVTLLLILGLIYFLLKYLSKKQGFSNQTKSLENLGGISVGPNKTLQLIRLGQQIYLIGVGENIELLTELKDPKLIDDLLHSRQEIERNTPDPFKAIFRKLFFNKEKAKRDESDRFVKLFSQELDKLKDTRTQYQDQYRRKEHGNE